MEFDLSLTNAAQSYVPDVILACNDDITANMLSQDQRTTGILSEVESSKVLKRSNQTTPEDTFETSVYKKELSHFKSEEEVKSPRQSDQEINDDDDSEEIILVPYEFQGDGRKREAKRHKNRTVIPQEEIDLNKLISEYQNSNPKVRDLEYQLEDLKN